MKRYQLKIIKPKRLKLIKKVPDIIAELVGTLKFGIDNAIKAPELEQLLGLERERYYRYARMLVREAVIDYGFPIGSNNTGFFLIANEEELNIILKNLHSRRKGIQDRIDALTTNFYLFHSQ